MIRARIATQAGITVSDVSVLVTHTHAAPNVDSWLGAHAFSVSTRAASLQLETKPLAGHNPVEAKSRCRARRLVTERYGAPHRSRCLR